MKKVLVGLVLLTALYCSGDDKDECKKVTGLSATEVDGVWVYYFNRWWRADYYEQSNC